jgi:hypothetical protein
MVSGVWLAASKLLGRPVSADEPYPCRCWLNRRDCDKAGPWGCPCYGRADVEAVPGDCCARRRLLTRH